jgi:integrase
MGKKILCGKITGIYPKSRNLEEQWFVQYWSGEERPRKLKAQIFNYSTVEARIAAADKIIADIKSNNYLPQKGLKKTKIIVDYLAKAFELLEVRRGTYPPDTYSQFKGHLSRLNDFCNKNTYRSINTDVGDRFLDSLMADGLKGTTVNNYRTTYNALFNHLKKRGIIRNNPFYATEKKKGESESPEWYKKHEALRLKKYMLDEKPFLWAAARWLFYCLLRPKSLRNLKISDIDFDRWQIKLRANNTKNSKTYFVAIPEGLKRDLEPLCLYQNPPNYYLVSYDGLPGKEQVGKNFWNRHHNKVLEICGFDVDTHTFYGWKHTGFAQAYLNGVGILELMKQAGHHSPDESFKYMRRLGLEDFSSLKEKYPIL